MTPDDRNAELWAAYRENPSDENRWALVVAYRGISGAVAAQIGKTIPEREQWDDLYEEAVLGLHDAIQRFEPDKGLRFNTYATFRVRGHVMDYLRKLDFRPRLVRENINRKTRVLESLYVTGPANDVNRATAMGMSEEEYFTFSQRNQDRHMVPAEDTRSWGNTYTEVHSGEFVYRRNEAATATELYARVEASQEDASNVRDFWKTALRPLSQRDKLLMLLYYREGLNMAEIAEQLGVSESRVSQIHKAIIKGLRASPYLEDALLNER